MSDKLKKGWTRVAFGDVVRQVRDHANPEDTDLERYIAGEHMDTDDLRIRRWGLIGDGYLGPAFHMHFKPGHVLYGSRRTYLRKVAVPDFEGITANTTFVLEVKDRDVLLPELLPFIMQTESFHDHSIKQSKGSVNPYINFSDLTWYQFDLPSLDEQRRIVEVLEAAMLVKESLRSLHQFLFAVVHGILEESLRAFSHNARIAVEDLLLEPPRNGVSPSENTESRGLKTVSISAVRDGSFAPAGCIKYTEIAPSIAHPFFVKRGDTFVIRGNGNRQLCGKAGLSEASYDDVFYPDLLIRLRFDPTKILPIFAVAQWNLPSVHGRLSSRAKSSNGIWKVNGQDIRVHTLSVPSIEEQQRVMDRVALLRNGVNDARKREMAVARTKEVFVKDLWGHYE